MNGVDMRIRAKVTGLLLVVASVTLLAGPATAVPQSDCSDPYWYDRTTTTKGTTVWIPSSRVADPFQWGGSQSISVAEGRMDARTKGRADTIGGTGGINVSIYKAEAKFEQQHQKSTTVTNVFTTTFSTDSGKVSRNVHWRWRLYVKGYMFKVTRRTGNPSPCSNRLDESVVRRIIVPVKQALYSFDIETYKTRGWIHNNAGDPIRT